MSDLATAVADDPRCELQSGKCVYPAGHDHGCWDGVPPKMATHESRALDRGEWKWPPRNPLYSVLDELAGMD